MSDVTRSQTNEPGIWQGVFQPSEAYLKRALNRDRTKDELLPLFVGILSLALAFVVALIDEFTGVGCARDSISHYFYAPIAGPFLVVTLAFVSAFMFAYRGQNRWDGWLTTFGAGGAIMVAMFPTKGIGCGFNQPFDFRFIQTTVGQSADGGYIGLPPVELTGLSRVLTTPVEVGDQTYLIASQISQNIHFTGAAVLIGVLVLVSAIHLGRTHWKVFNLEEGTFLERIVGPWEKRFTGLCLLIMVIGSLQVIFSDASWAVTLSLWIGWSWSWLAELVIDKSNANIPRPVFHGEMLALLGFGSAWIVQWVNYRNWINPRTEQMIY